MRWLLAFVSLTLACGGSSPTSRTADTDGDGLSDEAERIAGTSPTEPDSDQDGANDLVEVALGTGALNPRDNPGARGYLVFVMPWMEAPKPARGTLDFRTYIEIADIYFLFDKSAPNQDEIDAMRDSVEMTLGDLTCAELEDPSMRTCVPSIYSGVGQYHDPYNNLLSLQPDHAATRDRMDTINAQSDISKADFLETATC